MIADALKFLVDLASKGERPVAINTDDPTKDVYALGGQLVDVPKPIPAREHAVESLDDLIRLAARFDGEVEGDDDKHMPVVWVDEHSVFMTVDDSGYRADSAEFKLPTSPQFDLLRAIAAGKEWFTQKAFVRLLRVELAGAIEPAILLNKVREVKFENGQTTHGVVKHQQESLGREIQSRLKSTEIPEQVVLAVPVFAARGEDAEYPVLCAVDVDPAAGTFQLMPLPGQLDRAVQAALGSIRRRLDQGLPEGVPAYYGRP